MAAFAPSAPGGAVADVNARTLKTAVGFCGCELLRRTIGAAHWFCVEDIADAGTKVRAERLALKSGAALVELYSGGAATLSLAQVEQALCRVLL